MKILNVNFLTFIDEMQLSQDERILNYWKCST